MNPSSWFSKAARIVSTAAVAGLLSQCATSNVNRNANVVVSVKDQKMALYSKDGKRLRTYPVSTSKFGLSDKPGTYGTPLGMHEIVAKIGHGVPAGSVFKSRQLTGEVLKPDAPGRDPIVTRIMWLRGLEPQNQNAYSRCIYIHGTAEERNIGKPVSYGCIRMTSKDVMDVFNRTGVGSSVLVVQGGLPGQVPAAPPVVVPQDPADAPPIFLNPNQQPRGPLARPEDQAPMLAQNTPAPLPQPANAEVPAPKRSLLKMFSRDEAAASSAPALASASLGVAPAPASVTEETIPGTESQAGNFASRRLQSGATVIYSATPGSGSAAPVVLKSKRSASQGIASKPKVASTTP